MKLNSLDYVLYRTRKSPLEACRELMIEYTNTLEINLKQCTSCGIWLKEQHLHEDLDGLLICKDCSYLYGN